MKLPRLYLTVALAFSALLLPPAASAATFTFDTPISGDVVTVVVTLQDAPGGNGVDLAVSIPPGAGDLLGVFGNVVDESLVPQMGVEDPTGFITQWQFQANEVWKVGGGNTMTPVKNWDWGVRIDEQGSSGGAIESASFRLTAPGLDVNQVLGASNQGWVLAVRIQSTTGPEGSSKMGLSDAQEPDPEPPVIEILVPADGTLLGATPSTVSGSITGTDPSVEVNGVPATVTDETFSASVPLVEGANTLVATATNIVGTDSDQVDVVLDTTPPAVTITAPPDGLLTTLALSDVLGTVVDASPIVRFEINGASAALVGGAFETTVALGLGTNPIEAEAEDAAGNVGTAQVIVTRGEPPTVTIDVPADGTLTNQTPVSVSGAVTGTDPVSVEVNATAATVGSGSYSASVSLVEGANTLVATATNPFGSATASVQATLDTIPPVVTIEDPAQGATFDDPEIVVSGTVVDASPIAELQIGGDALTPGNAFVAPRTLVEGANSFTVTATDAAGNSGSDSVSVSLKTGEPLAVTIDSPPDGALVSSKHVNVAGRVSDDADGVDVNGVGGALDDERYAVAAVSLEEGPNTLTATARRGGETATAAITITYNVPPGVIITSPADGDLIRQAQTDVHGLVDDPTAFVDVNGVSATVTDAGQFVAEDIPLQIGSNRLTARAIDPLGAEGSDSVSVTRDDDALGPMRVVLLDPERFPFELDPSDVVQVIAGDVESFRDSLAQLGLDPSRYDKPVDDITIGFGSYLVFIYVFTGFGTIGQDVFLPAAGDDPFFSNDTQSLRPISDLEDDLADLGFDPGLAERMLPSDFEPNGFARFDLFLGGGGPI